MKMGLYKIISPTVILVEKTRASDFFFYFLLLFNIKTQSKPRVALPAATEEGRRRVAVCSETTAANMVSPNLFLLLLACVFSVSLFLSSVIAQLSIEMVYSNHEAFCLVS